MREIIWFLEVELFSCLVFLFGSLGVWVDFGCCFWVLRFLNVCVEFYVYILVGFEGGFVFRKEMREGGGWGVICLKYFFRYFVELD